MILSMHFLTKKSTIINSYINKRSKLLDPVDLNF